MESSKIRRLKKCLIDLIGSENEQNEEFSKDDLDAFEGWISSKEYLKDLEKYKDYKENEKKMDCIVDELRELLPEDAIVESERITSPECEDMFNVDAFLYDDMHIDRFFPNAGKYCADCHSRNIKSRDLISHSLSREKMKYIFEIMLPADCSDKKILDVGSRIGAVLYGAYFYSNCKNIFGIEMNKELCIVQRTIIDRYHFEDRIKVINDDIMTQRNLAIYDIVILNNVFEYFCTPEKQIEIWTFLKGALKPGCILITIPSMAETLENLNLLEMFSNWLKHVPNHQPENNCYSPEDESEFHDMFMYEVK